MGKCKRVRCLETGQVFESETQASKDLGLWATHISHVCTGARKTTGGLHFEFVDAHERFKTILNRK